MKYLLRDDMGWHIDPYISYLEGVKESMPQNAKNFALMPWHYAMTDHRCPHDSWVESVKILENGAGDRGEIREIDICASFLGAFHDLRFEILYKGVKAYSMSLKSSCRGDNPIGHGDWIIDEVVLEDNGSISHEIIFSDSGRWLINCVDIVYSYQEISGSDE